MCFDIKLEFQPRFPGRSGQGFHSSVVHVTAAIEHDLLDPGGAGALSDFFSDHFGGCVSLSSELAAASVRPLRSSTTCA
jgi:hypothetical protein